MYAKAIGQHQAEYLLENVIISFNGGRRAHHLVSNEYLLAMEKDNENYLDGSNGHSLLNWFFLRNQAELVSNAI